MAWRLTWPRFCSLQLYKIRWLLVFSASDWSLGRGLGRRNRCISVSRIFWKGSTHWKSVWLRTCRTAPARRGAFACAPWCRDVFRAPWACQDCGATSPVVQTYQCRAILCRCLRHWNLIWLSNLMQWGKVDLIKKLVNGAPRSWLLGCTAWSTETRMCLVSFAVKSQNTCQGCSTCPCKPQPGPWQSVVLTSITLGAVAASSESRNPKRKSPRNPQPWSWP